MTRFRNGDESSAEGGANGPTVMGVAAPAIVLLHSPLVGALAWQPVADTFRGRGYDVAVPSLSEAIASGPPYYPAMARAVDDAIRASGAGSVLLVPHSGAGPLVPSAVAATKSRIAGVLFVDATLPHPGRAWFDSVPAELAQQLRQLSTAGLLPPWNEWFPPGLLPAILPDPDVRSRFTDELPRLPLTFFHEVAPLVEDWQRVPCAYLRLSEVYDTAADQARQDGWPISRYEGHHLSILTDSHVIADHLEALFSRLKYSPDRAT